MVYKWTNKLQSLFFPATCRLCLAPAPYHLALCPACQAELPWITHSCARCAIPLPREAGASLCSSCIKTQPALDQCRALFAYRPPVDRWIQDMKFVQDLAAARLLGQLLAEKVSADCQDRPDIVMPVPLHRKRLAERGYNQSLEIARTLRECGYPLDTDSCQRDKTTVAQSNLPASARQANVRNAFSVSQPPEGGRVLLIDDVMTTGATLNEVARTLKKAGAEWVGAWVVARTL